MAQAKQAQAFWQKWGKPVAMSLLISGVAVGSVGIITWANEHNISDSGDHTTDTISSSPESIPPTSPTELATTKIESNSTIISSAIIAAVSIILALIFHFDKKIEDVRSNLSNEINNKIDSTNSKIDNTNNKVDNLSNKIDTGNQLILNMISSGINDFNRRIDSTNTRIDKVYQATGIIDPS